MEHCQSGAVKKLVALSKTFTKQGERGTELQFAKQGLTEQGVDQGI